MPGRLVRAATTRKRAAAAQRSRPAQCPCRRPAGRAPAAGPRSCRIPHRRQRTHHPPHRRSAILVNTRRSCAQFTLTTPSTKCRLHSRSNGHGAGSGETQWTVRPASCRAPYSVAATQSSVCPLHPMPSSVSSHWAMESRVHSKRSVVATSVCPVGLCRQPEGRLAHACKQCRHRMRLFWPAKRCAPRLSRPAGAWAWRRTRASEGTGSERIALQTCYNAYKIRKFTASLAFAMCAGTETLR